MIDRLGCGAAVEDHQYSGAQFESVQVAVELAEPDTFHAERWGRDPGYDMYFYDLADETVWGATGRMLLELLQLAFS